MTTGQEIILWHLTRHKIYIFPREKWTLSLQIWNSGALGNILSAINLQLSLLLWEIKYKLIAKPYALHEIIWASCLNQIIVLGVLIIFIMECRLGFRFWEFHSLWFLNNSTTKNSTRLDVQGCFEYKVRYKESDSVNIWSNFGEIVSQTVWDKNKNRLKFLS